MRVISFPPRAASAGTRTNARDDRSGVVLAFPDNAWLRRTGRGPRGAVEWPAFGCLDEVAKAGEALAGGVRNPAFLALVQRIGRVPFRIDADAVDTLAAFAAATGLRLDVGPEARVLIPISARHREHVVCAMAAGARATLWATAPSCRDAVGKAVRACAERGVDVRLLAPAGDPAPPAGATPPRAPVFETPRLLSWNILVVDGFVTALAGRLGFGAETCGAIVLDERAADGAVRVLEREMASARRVPAQPA